MSSSAQSLIHLWIHPLNHSFTFGFIRSITHSPVNSSTQSPIHLWIHPLNHSFTFGFIHSITHSPVDSSTQSLIHLWIHPLNHPFTCEFIHSITHSPVDSSTQSLIYLWSHPLNHSFTCGFIHSIIHSPVNSSTQSLIHLIINSIVTFLIYILLQNDFNALILSISSNQMIVPPGRNATLSLDTSALPADAKNYFYFDPVSRELRVNGSLIGTVSKNYTVCCVDVTDGRTDR